MARIGLVTPLGRRTLKRHPETPSDPVAEVSVEVGLEAPNVLVVCWRIVGDMHRLWIPDADASLDPERLWAHTCCEMFVAPAADEAYVEWNFSPSGQVARFEFAGYRRRRPSSSSAAAHARSSVAIEPRELRLEARAPLPPSADDSPRISLTTVIEDAAGALSYWALRHPCERPDFHHPGGFALALTLGGSLPIVTDVPESA